MGQSGLCVCDGDFMGSMVPFRTIIIIIKWTGWRVQLGRGDGLGFRIDREGF